MLPTEPQHRELAAFRMRGEWFRYTEEVSRAIAAVLAMEATA